jgi:RNA polymerase sigma-70 factor (ECF subfamily)
MDRYGNLVWSLARRFTSSRTDAEDAMQEIFIDLWSSAGRYDSAKASETTFVAMVARRRLIDRLHKTRREPGMEKPEAEAARASRLIQTLEPEQQKVVKLAVYHGRTHQSIANALGIPLGTVKTHLRDGLMRIRGAMQAPGTASGGEALP